MKTKLLWVAALSISLLGNTKAAWPQAGDQIRIAQRDSQDLYLAGQNIYIEAFVNGDVAAAGGSIHIEDTINGDVLLAGGDIQIRSFVTDDIRAFGGTINVENGAGGDILLFGGNLILQRGAQVKGDVIVFGGKVEINGTIHGSVKSYGGTVTLNGTVEKDIDIRGGEVYLNGNVRGDAILAAEKLHLGSDAHIGDHLRYWTRSGEMDFGNAATSIRYDETLGENFNKNGWSQGLGFAGFLLLSLLASLLLSIVLIFGFGRSFSKGEIRFRNDFIKSFAFGILYFIAMPVLIAILLVTIFGIPLGLLTLAFYIFSLIFAPTFAAVMLTYWFKDRNRKNWGRWLMWVIAGGLFIVIWLLIMIPFIGWLFGVVLIAAVYGALMLGASRKNSSPAAVH